MKRKTQIEVAKQPVNLLDRGSLLTDIESVAIAATDGSATEARQRALQIRAIADGESDDRSVDPRYRVIAQFLTYQALPSSEFLTCGSNFGTWRFFVDLLDDCAVRSWCELLDDSCLQFVKYQYFMAKLNYLARQANWPADLQALNARCVCPTNRVFWPLATYAFLNEPRRDEFLSAAWLPEGWSLSGFCEGTKVDSSVAIGIGIAIQLGLVHPSAEPITFLRHFCSFVGSRRCWPPMNQFSPGVDLVLCRLGWLGAADRETLNKISEFGAYSAPLARELGERLIQPVNIAEWSEEETFPWREGVLHIIGKQRARNVSDDYARFLTASTNAARRAIWDAVLLHSRREVAEDGKEYHPFNFVDPDAPEIIEPPMPSVPEIIEYMQPK